MSGIVLQDATTGKSFLAIQETLNVLQRYHLDVTAFKFVVIRDGETVLIIENKLQEKSKVEQAFGVHRGAVMEMASADLNALLEKLSEALPQQMIQGKSVRAIQAAAQAFLERDTIDFLRYKIEVLLDGNSLVVVFCGKDIPPGTFGNILECPGFEVELNQQNYAVLRSNFLR